MMNKQNIYNFSGNEIEVTWDSRLCIHIAECSQAKGELFLTGRQPWCSPDLVTREDVRDVVERCPSGALNYNDKSGQPEQAVGENTVAVAYNGPLFVTGDLQIEPAPDDMPGIEFRAALCRCGQSKNKPFCDNSHEKAGFRDYGAVGERSAKSTAKGGKLVIKPIKDGPFVISGNVTIRAGSGQVAWQGDDVALCRCGESKNKPFCDGSHKSAGFKSD